jgi:hypothetical protein
LKNKYKWGAFEFHVLKLRVKPKTESNPQFNFLNVYPTTFDDSTFYGVNLLANYRVLFFATPENNSKGKRFPSPLYQQSCQDDEEAATKSCDVIYRAAQKVSISRFF